MTSVVLLHPTHAQFRNVSASSVSEHYMHAKQVETLKQSHVKEKSQKWIDPEHAVNLL